MSNISFHCLSRIRAFYLKNTISFSCIQEMSSCISTIWPNINQIIRIENNIKIVFDHKHCIPFFYESIEDMEELLNIREMKPCCWFIEDIESF